MDIIKDSTEEIELDPIFVHVEEAINSKINMILCIHKYKYTKMISLLADFHTLLAYLKTLHIKYGFIGLQDWWVDAVAIADGSVMQSI